jgi:CRISPR-associated protein Cmr2
VPAEFVMAGGDDLILIVPAHAALGVAERFITGFQEKSLRLQLAAVEARNLARPFSKAGLTTSAGVVISHASYPAVQLVDLAAELMKRAKRRAADLKGTTGTLDFMVVHEPGTESVKRRRKEYEGTLPTGRPVLRTERPCTVEESARLRRRILALKESDVPRGKLKALYASLFRNAVEAQYEAARIRERLVATGSLQKSEPLRELLEELPFFPFRESPRLQESPRGGWSTSLSELIEVYDFIHPKAEGLASDQEAEVE